MSTGSWITVPGSSPVYTKVKIPRRFLARQRAQLQGLRALLRDGATPAEVDAAVAGALVEIEGLLR